MQSWLNTLYTYEYTLARNPSHYAQLFCCFRYQDSSIYFFFSEASSPSVSPSLASPSSLNIVSCAIKTEC